MSFFRNIRSSMTRSKNSASSRDTTPVRTSRPASVTDSVLGRRDSSVDSRADSLFNRSDTFILANRDSDVEDKTHSNTSTLEKKSKKFKALSKFSTFTKRKKSPILPAASDSVSPEHHPSENATNTYYKWQSETPSTMDYDAKTDPFHFLYEQPSSLKALQNSNGYNTDYTERRSSSNSTNTGYDSATYRKGKGPTTSLLKGQLEQMRTQNNAKLTEQHENEENEAEKYKTVTLNSFRKSFRDKFLQQQNEAPHNPAWFVEVEKPHATNNQETGGESRKEQRTDMLVFENDNYRPESRSPVRDRKSRPRSPVKRNETFRVDRSLSKDEQPPSIRIEIKNSITPNLPGRMVPVGVAKPFTTNFYNQQQHQAASFPHSAAAAKVTATTTSSRYQNTSPARNLWAKLQPFGEISDLKHSKQTGGRFQTLVQIRNDSNHSAQQQSPIVNRSSLPIRIQLGAGGNTPTPQKRQSHNLNSSSRYTTMLNSQPINSYEFAKNSNRHKSLLSAKPTKTYFGDTAALTTTTGSRMTAVNDDYGGCYVGAPATTSTALTGKNYSRLIPTSGYAAPNRNYERQLQQQQQQQQHRFLAVPVVQRRSRSPIKMPWR